MVHRGQRPTAGHPGGILWVVDQLEAYTDALTFDFRRLGLSIVEVGASVTFGEAAALIRELTREFGSHYSAAIDEWDFVPDPAYGAVLLGSLLEGYIYTHRSEKDRGKPINVPRPWGTGKRSERVTDAEMDELLQQLEKRSAFRDRD